MTRSTVVRVPGGLALLVAGAVATGFIGPVGLTGCIGEANNKGDAEQKSADVPEQASKAETKSETPTKPEAPRGKQVPAPDDVEAPPADAQKTATGIAYKVLEPADPAGGDAKPGPNDTVKVEYTGWTTDGATFDTTEGRGARTFGLGKVIPGWTEGMQLMRKGEKTRFWIPEELAYKGRAGAPQGMLVFDVKLLDIIAAPQTPPDVAAPPADAKKTASGLAYKVLTQGTGKDKPRAWDKVTVNYSGWTTDGKMFDSSTTRGQPASFPLDKVVPGWTEGMQLMSKGDKFRFWIPEALAYKGQPGKPQGMLVFDIELVEVEKLPDPPPVPKDVAAPPADAKKTESGLAYKVLSKGKGTEKPGETSNVSVHYSGWTTDGKMFDSSVTRGQPSTFPLNRVIKGWTEGVQLMSPGDKFRFWIPEALAYQGRPGKPAGMLVFDVELIEIKK